MVGGSGARKLPEVTQPEVNRICEIVEGAIHSSVAQERARCVELLLIREGIWLRNAGDIAPDTAAKIAAEMRFMAEVIKG